jgi:hypothetical protein
MLEESSPKGRPDTELIDGLRVLPCLTEPAALDAEWHRCRRQAHHLIILETAHSVLAIGVLLVVALCGIVAITHTAVMTGAVALPLGLGLALTISLLLLGLAFRARLSREILSQHIVRLECARRNARRDSPQPYRTAAPVAEATCTYCLFDELHSIDLSRIRSAARSG